MKRLLLLAVFLLLAQNARATAVSATVTDAGAQAWAGGSYAFVWVPAPGFSGTPPAIPAPGLLDGSGAFTSVTVTASTSIFPSGSKWIVRVCPIASASCYSTAPLTITGTTQNITAFITPPAISVLSSTGNQPVAYVDAEITTPLEGFLYLNYTSGKLRIYHSGAFADVGNTGTLTGSGTNPKIAIWSTSTSLGNIGTPTVCSGGTPVATGIDANGNAICAAEAGNAVKVCSQVSVVMPTSAINTASKSSSVTGTCTGLTTSDTISCSASVEIFGVTGFVPTANGILALSVWPTTDTINAEYANNTSGTLTPGALTLKCQVIR